VTRAGAPLVVAERAVAVDAGRFLQLAAEQAGAGQPVTVGVYVEGEGARAAEPVLHVPPGALRELSRALALLAGELGER